MDGAACGGKVFDHGAAACCGKSSGVDAGKDRKWHARHKLSVLSARRKRHQLSDDRLDMKFGPAPPPGPPPRAVAIATHTAHNHPHTPPSAAMERVRDKAADSMP